MFPSREPLVPLAGIVVGTFFPALNDSFVKVASAVGTVAFFAHHVCHAFAYAKVLGVNVVVPPPYGPDGKMIKRKGS